MQGPGSIRPRAFFVNLRAVEVPAALRFGCPVDDRPSQDVLPGEVLFFSRGRPREDLDRNFNEARASGRINARRSSCFHAHRGRRGKAAGELLLRLSRRTGFSPILIRSRIIALGDRVVVRVHHRDRTARSQIAGFFPRRARIRDARIRCARGRTTIRWTFASPAGNEKQRSRDRCRSDFPRPRAPIASAIRTLHFSCSTAAPGVRSKMLAAVAAISSKRSRTLRRFLIAFSSRAAPREPNGYEGSLAGAISPFSPR